jgi:hypothetical protein
MNTRCARAYLVYYLYDNFEQDDVDCHYDILEDQAGYFCTT